MPANTLQTVATWLARCLPKSASFGASETRDLLGSLGWAAPPGVGDLGLSALLKPDLIEKLDQLDFSVNTGDGDSPGALQLRADLLTGLLDFFNAARTFASGLSGRLAAAGDYAAKTDIVNQFLPRLQNYMVVRLVEQIQPTLYYALFLVGIFKLEPKGDDQSVYQIAHLRYSIDFGRLHQLLSDPVAIFEDIFQWNTPAFSSTKLIGLVGALLQAMGLPSTLEAIPRRVEERLLGRAVPEATAEPLPRIIIPLHKSGGWDPLNVGVVVFATRASGPGMTDGGIGFSPFVLGTKDSHFDIAKDVAIDVQGIEEVLKGAALLVRPNGSVQLNGNILAGGALTPLATAIAFTRSLRPGGDAPYVLLAIPGGSRLEFEQLQLSAGARPGAGSKPELFVELGFQKARFILSVDEAGGLLTALIPKSLVQAEFELGIGWAAGKPYLRGSASLAVDCPVHLSFGPVELETITVGLAPGSGGALPIEVSTSLETTFGPLDIVVDRIGVAAAFDFVGGAGGNLGPFNIDLNFKLPSGIGISLDVGPVSGGGYLALDPDGHKYAGALDIKLSFVHVSGYGIYEQTADGSASFVAVIGARFNPGIQLGFGFALTGVGGLIGQNRQVNSDLLRERLASGAAGNVLFCDDPVRNAPTLLGDLADFFPVASPGFLIGPTLQISWLSPIVRLDVGIILQFPGPSKILLLGSVRAVIGLSEDLALLFVRMDFLGSIEFDKQLIAFDAQLVNSQALGIFRLTGGTALRLNYGGSPYILLTIGGFHPRFDPGPLNLPFIPRVGASLDETLVAEVYLRLEMYLAFTSNTLQVGAHVHAGMELGPLSANGHFDFDALVQFRPFLFDADFSAGFSVDAFGVSFCGVDVEGRISGPGPVVVHAEGSVRRLGIKVSGSATFELGDHDADQVSPIPSVVKALEPELSNVANLRTSGHDEGVILKPVNPPAGAVLVSPKGNLIWEQKRAPLNTTIQRFEGTSLNGNHELRVSTAAGWATSEEQDWFSPGMFAVLDLQASQTLNNAGFEQLPSGLSIASAADVLAPTVVDSPMNIDLFKRPLLRRVSNFYVGNYMTAALTSGLRQRATTPAIQSGEPKVKVAPETSDVYDAKGGKVLLQQTSFQAFQVARQAPGRISVPSADVSVAL
jgi:hypothetical protein